MNTPIEPHQRKLRRRTKILAALLLVWVLAIVARLLQLQVLDHSRLGALVAEQNQARINILPDRGVIYDRRGHILAQSIPAASVFFSPASTDPPEAQLKTVEAAQPVLGLAPPELEKIRAAIGKRSRFIWLKRKADPETAGRLKAAGLNGVFAQEEKKRFYPQAGLAAHVLGGVSLDDAGQCGVELRYDSVLRGKVGSALILRDARKKEYHFEVVEEPQRGADIVLTIDQTIQYVAQRELEKAVRENEADWGTAIVMHPGSGEILAMANWPAYDPNHYPPDSAEAEPNRGIHHLFEPGSMFKIVTASAALENNRVTLDEVFDCSRGSIETAGSAIRDHETLGILTFPDVIVHSSNVGTIQVGRKIGSDLLYRMIKAFRFGEKTGVDLPAEASGTLRAPARWTNRSLDSLSIGYEVSATALQVLQAMSVIANRGLLVPPRIVKAVRGSALSGDPGTAGYERVITDATARELIPILERVVLEGTGTAALAKGYTMAGKTGTTQKYDPAIHGYSASRHIASFVGFVPVENPLLSIIVVLDEPKKYTYYGGQVAAPVFREIAVRALRYLHAYPQPESKPPVVTARLMKGGRP